MCHLWYRFGHKSISSVECFRGVVWPVTQLARKKDASDIPAIFRMLRQRSRPPSARCFRVQGKRRPPRPRRPAIPSPTLGQGALSREARRGHPRRPRARGPARGPGAASAVQLALVARDPGWPRGSATAVLRRRRAARRVRAAVAQQVGRDAERLPQWRRRRRAARRVRALVLPTPSSR